MITPQRLAFRLLIPAGVVLLPVLGQQFDNLQRERARQMLKDVVDTIRKNYYDVNYHGVDLEARFKEADQKLRNTTTLGDAFAEIARTIQPLKDSHTFFVPPTRSTRREYGYVSEMVGDRCFVTAVRPNTNATEKLAPGDEILKWEGFSPTRAEFWDMNYLFNTLYSATLHHLVVRSPNGAERTVELAAKEHQGKRILDLTGNGDGDIWQVLRDQENDERLMAQRTIEFGPALMIWKMPEFDIKDQGTDTILKQARQHAFLVLDLRGNPGGLVVVLEHLVGAVMDHDVTIATRTGRKPGLKPIKARALKEFSGKLIVLIDSRSASAAELFARVVQLEHRGVVLGDHSSGKVMESRYYPFQQGTETVFTYGASITDADLIMADGKSLERNGVVPDEVILPSAEDLARGRDPVLMRAAQIAGVDLDPARAGRIFPVEWRKD